MIPNVNKVLYQVDGYTDADRAKQVVNEYAKAVAIDFNEWRELHYGLFTIADGKYVWQDNDGNVDLTSEQLFELYLKQTPQL